MDSKHKWHHVSWHAVKRFGCGHSPYYHHIIYYYYTIYYMLHGWSIASTYATIASDIIHLKPVSAQHMNYGTRE